MKITIESPSHKGTRAELWEVHNKISAFLRKKHLHSLDIYTPTCVGNRMEFDVKQTEHGTLILNEIKSLISQKTTWKWIAEGFVRGFPKDEESGWEEKP